MAKHAGKASVRPGYAAGPFGTGGTWIVPLAGGHGAEGASRDSGH